MGYRDFFIHQGIPIFQGGDVDWRLYQKALIPLSPLPKFISLSDAEAEKLTKESGAFFIRWTSDPTENETGWWWIITENYDSDNLPKKTRYGIRKGLEYFRIEKVSSTEIAKYGYESYVNSFFRYIDASPMTKDQFRKDYISRSEDFGFDYWGVYSSDRRLMGYAQCIVEEKGSYTNVIKIDPKALRLYANYVLFDHILSYYINTMGIIVTNGVRSIYHDTNIQDFLLKFGFRRQYCKLNIVYSPYLKQVIHLLYPFRNFIGKMPSNYMNKINSLLFQEKVRRACYAE